MRYLAVIPESDDPWQRIPLALFRVDEVDGVESWAQLDLQHGGWTVKLAPPAAGPDPLVELNRGQAGAVIDEWIGLRAAAPWVDLDGTTRTTSRPRPISRGERWQWRIFAVAMAIVVIVVVARAILT